MPTTPGAERDLAVALWRGSPLARRDVASAVQVDVGAAEPSLFSYGLTIREGEIDPESLPPAGVRAEHWIDGGATVVQSGAADAGRASQAVLFWIVPLAAPALAVGSVLVGWLGTPEYWAWAPGRPGSGSLVIGTATEPKVLAEVASGCFTHCVSPDCPAIMAMAFGVDGPTVV